MPKKASSLLPPSTGGKLIVPGFHRTKLEDSVASIGFEAIKESRSSSLYGAGFYMTRTLTAQQMPRMEHYGPLIVRCAVDISRFVCFEKAVAHRLWGEKFTLKDQLLRFKGWTPEDRKIIGVASEVLSRFWKHKIVLFTPQEIALLSPRQTRMDFNAVLARSLYLLLRLNKKVPGIIYTGSADGPCVLAYDLSRVKSISFRREETNSERVQRRRDKKKFTNPWIPFTDHSVLYRLRPKEKLKDDIATYTLALQNLSPFDRTTVLAAYNSVPSIGERWAFLIAFCAVIASRKSQTHLRHHVLKNVLADRNMIDFLNLKTLPSTIEDIPTYGNKPSYTSEKTQLIFERRHFFDNIVLHKPLTNIVLKTFFQPQIKEFTIKLEAFMLKMVKSRSSTLPVRIAKVLDVRKSYKRYTVGQDDLIAEYIIACQSRRVQKNDTSENPGGINISSPSIAQALEHVFYMVVTDLRTEKKVQACPECLAVIDAWLDDRKNSYVAAPGSKKNKSILTFPKIFQ